MMNPMLIGIMNQQLEERFLLTIVTTGAQTLTLNSLGVVAGETVTVEWGDGTSDTYSGASSRTHAYSEAGTWVMEIKNPKAIERLDLRDAKIAFDSICLRACGSNLSELLLIFTSAGTYRFHSEDAKHLTCSLSFFVFFNQAGSYAIDSVHFKDYGCSTSFYALFSQAGNYTIDSVHFKDYGCSTYFYARFQQAGNYTIDSVHFKDYGCGTYFYAQFTQAGNYTIDSAHFKDYGCSSFFYAYFNQAGNYTIDMSHFSTMELSLYIRINVNNPSLTVARTDMAGWTNTNNIYLENNSLSAAQVDEILLGLYDMLPSRTATGGTVELTGNDSPNGVLQANPNCSLDPTGKEAAHELVNDGCGRATAEANRWANVNIE